MERQAGLRPALAAVRATARRIGPLYWLVGGARYLGFRLRLDIENRRHAARGEAGIPPPMLRYRVHGALDAASYGAVGRAIAARIVEIFARHGLDLAQATVLDFACGPGRVVAELKRLAPGGRLHGSDIDPEAIAWATENLSTLGSFRVNAPAPPSGYAAESFDAAYSVSLFTHLDEDAQMAWLAELARIVRPGGWVLATLHGAQARGSCTGDELRRLERQGIAFRVDRTGRFKLDGLPDFYQTTFHTREYVLNVWSGLFEVVEYLEGGLDGHQDVVVLRRRLHAS